MFQAIFGAIFTVIIALEFKRSLLVVAERQESIVQVRTVILIALLAIVRKLIILDLASTDALQLFALAAAILALGAVYRQFEIKIAASNAISLRKNVSWGDHRPLRVSCLSVSSRARSWSALCQQRTSRVLEAPKALRWR